MKKLVFFIILFLICISNIDALGLSSIYIDGKSCSNNSTIETCLNSETYSYDKENKILTLNNYNGGRVTVYSTTNGEDEITIHLKGENNVNYTGSDIYAFGSGIPLTITADEDASLTINGNYKNTQYISVAMSCDKKLTISGGKINVNLRTDVESETGVTSVGIGALEGLIINGNADVSISVDTDYNQAYGIRVGNMSIENVPIHLGENAKLKIDINTRNKLNKNNATNSSYMVYGISSDIKIEGIVEEQDSINDIAIDNKVCKYDSSIEECVNGSTYSWDKETRTLTLNNYNSGRVNINSYGERFKEKEPITIHLIGNNIITESSVYSALISDFETEITAEEGATLIVNNSSQSDTTNSAVEIAQLLTISGGNIIFNNNYNYETEDGANTFVINSRDGIIIKNNANVTIKSMNDYDYAVGLYLGRFADEEPKIYVEKNAKLTFDLNVKNKLNSDTITKLSYKSVKGTPDIKIDGEVIEINQFIKSITIGDKKCLNDINMNDCATENTYLWNSETNTLTLNNYDSGKIIINKNSGSLGEEPTIKINLKGNNKITEKSEYSAIYSDFNTEIISDKNSSLIVNYSNQTKKQHQVIDIRKKLTISGGNITLNNKYNYENDKSVSSFIISAYHGFIIKDNANVTLNALNDYNYAGAIVVGGTNIEKPPIHVEKNSVLNIDLQVKNKLNASTLTRFSYTYYSGTIGTPDKKIDGEVNEYNTIKSITIDDKVCWNDTNIEDCLSGKTYSWDKENNTLTLDNYNSNKIYIYSVGNRLGNDETVKILLKGDNVITESSTDAALHVEFNTEITSTENSSLTINNSSQANKLNYAVNVSKLLTINSANVIINNNYNYETNKNNETYAIQTKNGIIIKENSNVTIKSHTDYTTARAFVFGGTNIENPKLYLDKSSTLKLELDAKNKLNASSIHATSYAMYSGTIGKVDTKIEGTVIENPIIDYIYIDNKKCANNGKINECFNNETYTWDKETYTLTLNNYNSGRIYVNLALGSMLKSPEKPINIYLKGENVIIEKSEYIGLYSNGNILIDGEDTSTLDIIHSRQNNKINTAVDINGLFTIQGGNINITNDYEYDSGKDVIIYGIEANKGLIIKDKANVKINVTNNYTTSRGIVVGGENIENPKIYIEDPASVEINLNARNILNDSSVSFKMYVYYTGTIGDVDINITGNLIENPSFRKITIDGKSCVNDSNIEDCLSGENYNYNKETNTLTLNNYHGNKISIVSPETTLGYLNPIKVHLIGDNTIFNESETDTPFEVQNQLDLEISAEENATLTLTRKCLVKSGNVALYIKNADLTIKSGNIIVNNIYEMDSAPTIMAAGIYLNNLTLRENANLQINVTSNYAKAYGLYFMTEKPTITIDSTSKIEINAVSKNMSGSEENMNSPFYFSKNPTTGKVELIYESSEDSNMKIMGGTLKENAKRIKDINSDLNEYQYFQIGSEKIENPKTGDNNLYYLLLVIVVTISIGSLIFINKKQVM